MEYYAHRLKNGILIFHHWLIEGWDQLLERKWLLAVLKIDVKKGEKMKQADNLSNLGAPFDASLYVLYLFRTSFYGFMATFTDLLKASRLPILFHALQCTLDDCLSPQQTSGLLLNTCLRLHANTLLSKWVDRDEYSHFRSIHNCRRSFRPIHKVLINLIAHFGR